MTIADLVAKRPITSLAVLLGMAAVAAFFAQQSQAAVTGKGYWQETQSETCSFIICTLNYSAVPATKQVTITSVSCAMIVNGTVIIREVRLGSKNAAAVQQANFTYLIPTANGTAGGFTYYSVNNFGVHILRAGEKANIAVTFATTPTGETVKCTIAGVISA